MAGKKQSPITKAQASRKRKLAKRKSVPKKPAQQPEETLTGKQLAFISAYLGEARFNATQAARIAGYAGDDNALAVQGHDNLRNPKIAGAVEARLAELHMSDKEVLVELADIARSDWRDHLVIKRDREGNEIEAYLLLKDKIRALELVGKYHKLFTDKTELTGRGGGPIETVGLSVDQWKEQAAARRAQAEKTSKVANG